MLAGILAGGTALRIYPSAGFTGVGFDESLYQIYVGQLNRVGLLAYPEMVEAYIQRQAELASAILPPTRFLYIFFASLWSRGFLVSPLAALHAISCLFSVLTVALGGFFALRLGGRGMSLGIAALLSSAPVQIHMAQHALIDGFFAFWALLALWALWECLREPDPPGWLCVYTAALALMVLTKENAFFVYVALLGVLALSWKLGLGRVTPRLLLLTATGPLLGAVVLLFLAGGVENVTQVYRLLIAKAHNLEYAIRTGDGPWHRYLVDLLLTSPLTLLLAIGAASRLRLKEAADYAGLYLGAFIVCSYALMCNVKYGMNLRYATIWDFPLRHLAFSQLVGWARQVGRREGWIISLSVLALCAYDLRQYHLFFVQNGLYELVSEGLLRALKILK